MAFKYPKQYDVIVVGAGHAGVEAALSSAKLGATTLMLSLNLDSIAQMSCNPAIGGSAKGHLVREIDALGGEMGIAADMTGLQFRLLNTRKGPSVWAPRAQCDKKAYQFRLKWICERQPNLEIHQGQAASLVCKNDSAIGVETLLGVRYYGKTVIVTTGTFLRGLLHIGSSQMQGGRSGDSAAMAFSDSLKQIGLELGRLKTGTPPRIAKRTIDFGKTEPQHGDEPISYFSYWIDELFHVEHPANDTQPVSCKYPTGSVLHRAGGQLPCYITSTTAKTAELIRSNLHNSPMYSGVIEGVGPRYCPSIEDKVVKFPDKESHQVFLEPEGVATDEIYVNGLSTCLPFDIQIELVRTLKGCESAQIMRAAYAVEYDFVFPSQLSHSLETKVCRNLYLAGQINGTSGYEEAAAQGLIAGINAARRSCGLEPIILGRDRAYIGVLIDDLITKGASEPYRMFTSRAEYRLLLRQDNADLRLSEVGHQVGLLSEERFRKVSAKREAIQSETERLESSRLEGTTLAQVLRRPGITYRDLPSLNESLSEEEIRQVEIAIKYAGYIERQGIDVKKSKEMESKSIPPWIDYNLVTGLRTEARQKLNKIRPSTLGQAARISGVSPADISLVTIWIRRAHKIQNRENAEPIGD